MMKTHMKRLFAPALALLLTACVGGPTVESLDEEQSALVDCDELGSEVTDHACGHALYGPFSTVNASASRSFSSTSPNVNSAHRHYTVNLPGSLGANEGTVKFRPTASGDFAIFLDPGVSMLVLNSSGGTVPFALEHAVSGCSALSAVKVVSLTAYATYRLVLGPASVSSVGVVIEKLSNFGNNGCD